MNTIKMLNEIQRKLQKMNGSIATLTHVALQKKANALININYALFAETQKMLAYMQLHNTYPSFFDLRAICIARELGITIQV
jgi:hypothetical protein